jgi:hypothetical protein
MNSWITAGDLTGLGLLVIALAVTAVTAFAEDTAARWRARWLAGWRRVRGPRHAAPAARQATAGSAPAVTEPGGPAEGPGHHMQPAWRPAPYGGAQLAAARYQIPAPRDHSWQSRPVPAGLVEDRVPGPAALDLEEAVRAGDQ